MGSLEETIRRWIEPTQYRVLIIPRAKVRHRRVIRRVQENGKANVVFLVSSLPMWRFQSVYDLLKSDERFSPSIAIYPFPSFGSLQKEEAMTSLRAYFRERGIAVTDLSQESFPGQALKDQLSPDILFFPQTYNYLYGNDLDNQFFTDSLNCYIPYSIRTSTGKNVYRSLFNDTAWRLFYPSKLHYLEAKSILYNKGTNIRITGDPIIDLIQTAPEEQVWKPQNKAKKRVIWAPHFSIIDNGIMHRDSFTWLSECMKEIANQYQESIQIAFKPHPRLKSELYALSGWGQEKTDCYYRFWEEGANTQLETGPYLDLFKESDAMIHDCGSFSVEYLLTGKPVLFTTQDVQKSIAGQNELGQQAILAHYHGATREDIQTFIEKTVLGGEDSKIDARKAIYNNYLQLPRGRSAAENIYNEILAGLGF